MSATGFLEKAIEAVGGPAKLAAAIGVTPQVVASWRSRAGLDKAIKAVGGPSKLAVAIGVTPQVIANWRRRSVPAERCPAIERATRTAGGAVVLK